MIHNGYFGHAYGSPWNPILVDRDTIIYLVEHGKQEMDEDSIMALSEGFMDFVYTNDRTKISKKTFGNRILGLYSLEGCIIDKELKYVTFEEFGFDK
ncbi:MAG: hypothetical protein Roseis3KO_53120 [Roseivirga sp.]